VVMGYFCWQEDSNSYLEFSASVACGVLGDLCHCLDPECESVKRCFTAD